MNSVWRNILISAALLGGFAVLGSLLVATTHELTAEQIAANEREFLLETLHVLVPSESYDNDLYNDVITLSDPLLAQPGYRVLAYRARRDGQPYAVVLTPYAHEGYNGDIRLLVAIRYDGQLLGVRVLRHQETPGLGDGIEARRSDWIHSFRGRSLDNTADAQWRVQKDGGKFHQLTGATITPRAIVKAVHDTLRYYEQHRDELFARPALTSGEDHE